MKSLVLDSPALRPIDYESSQPVILAVDSCANGAGYVILQVGADGKRYPSRFGSITFNERESRYSQAKLELYGLLRALKHTQLYTIGVKRFIVEMDAKFIKGMINHPTLHPNDAINRWISAILLFNFELVHVPAERHTGADGLSRRPRAPEDPSSEDQDELEEWIDSATGFFFEMNAPLVANNPIPPWSLVFNTSSPTSSDPELEIPRSSRALLRDRKLVTIRQFLSDTVRPPGLSDDEYKSFIRQAMGFYLVDSKLFRKNKSDAPQLVPQSHERLAIIAYTHDRLGHKGVFATTKNLLVRFWWPHLNNDVRWYIRTCHECQVRQTERFHIPPIVPIVPSLFRKAHIDTFLMPKVGTYRYVIHARCALASYPHWGQGPFYSVGTC